MAAISVRDLDEDVAARLKVRAASHGRSMQAEVRTILNNALATDEDDRPNLAQAMREQLADLGDVELEIPLPPGQSPRGRFTGVGVIVIDTNIISDDDAR